MDASILLQYFTVKFVRIFLQCTLTQYFKSFVLKVRDDTIEMKEYEGSTHVTTIQSIIGKLFSQTFLKRF